MKQFLVVALLSQLALTSVQGSGGERDVGGIGLNVGPIPPPNPGIGGNVTALGVIDGNASLTTGDPTVGQGQVSVANLTAANGYVMLGSNATGVGGGVQVGPVSTTGNVTVGPDGLSANGNTTVFGVPLLVGHAQVTPNDTYYQQNFTLPGGFTVSVTLLKNLIPQIVIYPG